jgi:hypothetical protein
VSVTGLLVIKSNTTITVSAGKGAILRNSQNKPMFRNENFLFSGTPTDENIIIDGGIWNGNSTGQTQVGSPTYGVHAIFQFYGVDGLTVKNFEVRRQKCYSIHGINVRNGVYEDFVSDGGFDYVPGASPNNSDGVHFDGNCSDCRVSRGVLRTIDDAVGINLDDVWRYSGGVTYPFYPANTAGPNTNILVEDIELNGGLFGVRVLSGASRGENITIRRITGETHGYAVLIDNFWQHPDWITQAGTGNLGTITIEDIDVNVASTEVVGGYNEAVVSVTCNVEELVMNNISGSGTALPTIFIDDSGYTHGSITLDGVPYP